MYLCHFLSMLVLSIPFLVAVPSPFEHLLGFHSFHRRRYSPSLSKLRSTEAGPLSGKRKTEHLQIISLSYVQMWSSPPHLRKPKENQRKTHNGFPSGSTWIYLDLPGSIWNWIHKARSLQASEQLLSCLEKTPKMCEACEAMQSNANQLVLQQ